MCSGWPPRIKPKTEIDLEQEQTPTRREQAESTKRRLGLEKLRNGWFVNALSATPSLCSELPRFRFGFVFGFAWAVAGLWARASVQLDIPPRAQWDNNNGYCGECSIQQCALYYGTYISQYRAREIVYPTSQSRRFYRIRLTVP
jgi:hypothetical protein